METGIRARELAIILLIAMVFLAADFVFAQRVPLDHRYHWDGTYYIEYARNIDKLIISRAIDGYSFSRILPSALVHIGLRSLSISPSPQAVLYSFVFLNGLAVIASLVAWAGVAQALSLSRFQFGFGAVAVFVNFCFLKYNSFNPIGTDVLAFSISFWMLLCFLTRRTAALFCFSFLGAFCWPVLVYVGAALLALPRDLSYRSNRESHPDSSYQEFSVAWRLPREALILGVAAAGAAFFVQYVLNYQHSGAKSIDIAVPAAIAIVGAYVAFAVAPLLGIWRDIRITMGRPRDLVKSALIAAALIISTKAIIFGFAATGSRNSVVDFIISILGTAIKAPGIFLVGHFVYFGPIVIVAILRWKEACRTARELGPGYVCVLLMSLALAIGAESRQLMGNIVFLLVPVIANVRPEMWKKSYLLVFLVISLLLSRVWLVMDLDSLVFTYQEYLLFPWQWFFGAIGYWMPFEVYLIQVAIFMSMLLLCVAGGRLIGGYR